jgi:Xaa-Pro aminopeptidase
LSCWPVQRKLSQVVCNYLRYETEALVKTNNPPAQPRFLLEKVSYPNIGFPREARPEVPAAVFSARLARLRRRMGEQELDALVVYGDREHFANLAWLTNYDPRFEEALLVVLPRGKPVLFVGNEGWSYSNIARLPLIRELYQTFSLLGQPRETVKPLAGLLIDAGLTGCSRVGVAGWKYFSAAEFENPQEVLDAPEFVAQSVRAAIRPGGRVTNETALFMDAEHGLRSILEAEQIAGFEWVATYNSQSVLQGIRALKPGMTEMEGFSAMATCGLPFSCYPTCAGGERFLKNILVSPSDRRFRLGDPLVMTCAYQGANTCRFGWMARGPRDLPAGLRDYVETTAAPYAEALAAWYGTLRVGVTGHELYHAAWDRLTPLGFKLGLNVGHQIAADEWTDSMSDTGSSKKVRSGMYWQADFFAGTSTPHFGAFAEDGVVVADARLRQQIQRRWPAAWKRFQARRRFMIEQLGFSISEELLPMSNFPAAVIPYFLASDHCLASRG